MLDFFRSRSQQRQAASKLYGSVVAQAREPNLYRDLGVPDTREGRFECIVLHMVLVIERLRTDSTTTGLARAFTSAFVTDVDDTYREIGLSDTKVPRNVKKAAGALYTRTLEYRPLLEAGDTGGLASTLTNNVSMPVPGSQRLADYAIRAHQRLTHVDLDKLRSGEISFPPVAATDTTYRQP